MYKLVALLPPNTLHDVYLQIIALVRCELYHTVYSTVLHQDECMEEVNDGTKENLEGSRFHSGSWHSCKSESSGLFSISWSHTRQDHLSSSNPFHVTFSKKLGWLLRLL